MLILPAELLMDGLPLQLFLLVPLHWIHHLALYDLQLVDVCQ